MWLALQLQASALYICLFLSLLSLIGWALHLSYSEPTVPALAPGQWMTRWEEEVAASLARPTGSSGSLPDSFPLHFTSYSILAATVPRLYFMNQKDPQLGV